MPALASGTMRSPELSDWTLFTPYVLDVLVQTGAPLAEFFFMKIYCVLVSLRSPKLAVAIPFVYAAASLVR